MFWIKLRILWMNLTIFFCIYVLLLYFSFKHICLFWDLCYIDLFDSYVRFFFCCSCSFFGVFFYWKRKIVWDFVLRCSISSLYRFDIWNIKQWKLFVQAFDMNWFAWILLNYLSGTREAICHYRITHLISQIWFAMNLVSNLS